MTTRKKTAVSSPDTLNKNRLFYGDNLDVLRRKIEANSVDLCYIDPPFNSKRNYFQIYNNIGSDGDKAQAQAFMDTWAWGNESEKGLDDLLNIENLNNNKLTPQTVALIKGLKEILGKGDLFAYLVSMTLRIVEIHRVLKPTGSFYLHCDPTASHYLKLVLDSVFCADGNGGDFLNEIIWHYGQRTAFHKSHFSRKHDVIFFYSKSKSSLFNEVSEVWDKTQFLKNRHDVMMDENGEEYIWADAGKKGIRYKRKVTDVIAAGKPLDSVWSIPIINAAAKERLGYPTQKPEALLERIIKASSNEGDVVLDAYCGCGTTVAVAERLNRRWIGVDITYQSISLILYRLQKQHPKKWAAIEAAIQLDGIPRDHDSAVALANRKDDKTRKEFEKWAVLTYSNNQARINDKKGADGGIDGVAYFLIDKESNGKIVFQVKSGGVNRATIATLNSDRLREKAEFGFLITLDAPTKSMREEASAAGKYKHPLLSREDDRLQVVTIDDLLKGKRLDLPMGREMVKSADAVGDTDHQLPLI